MSVFVALELRRKCPQSLQCRIAKLDHLGFGRRINAANVFIEDCEMRQASNTAATDHVCTVIVAMLAERFGVIEQPLREVLEDSIISSHDLRQKPNLTSGSGKPKRQQNRLMGTCGAYRRRGGCYGERSRP
jgi:hypothetical protein